jgi:hypothetical protein
VSITGSDLRMNERTRVRDERGSVLAMTAMVLPVVLGFLGLMLDGALLLADNRELQDAADAAAVAGAMQIDMPFFAQTGQWRIADNVNLPGTPTSHEAAAEVCAAYDVICTTDIPSGQGRRQFHVVAQRSTRIVFMHLFTGNDTVHLSAESTSAMVPGF